VCSPRDVLAPGHHFRSLTCLRHAAPFRPATAPHHCVHTEAKSDRNSTASRTHVMCLPFLRRLVCTFILGICIGSAFWATGSRRDTRQARSLPPESTVFSCLLPLVPC